MKMNVSQLSKRDLERLSAYLDGVLNPKQAEQLEARLAHDRSLQTALDELREAAWLLRSLPEVEPPRRFSLTPEMVGHRPSRAYPAFKFATALLTAAFVFVLGFDVLGSTKGLADFATSGADHPSMEPAPLGLSAEREEAMAAEVVAEPVEEEAIVEPEEPAPEAFEPYFSTEDSQAITTDLPAMESPLPTQVNELAEGESDDSADLGEEQTGEVASNASGRGVQDEGAMPDSEDRDGATSPSEPSTAQKVSDGWQGDEYYEPETLKVEPIIVLEIGLAVTCIILALITLKLRKSTR